MYVCPTCTYGSYVYVYVCRAGCVLNTNAGLAAVFGAGAHQFVGGGVLVNTGVVSVVNFGIGEYSSIATPLRYSVDLGVVVVNFGRASVG